MRKRTIGLKTDPETHSLLIEGPSQPPPPLQSNKVLKLIDPDYYNYNYPDDYTAALYYQFAAQTDIWMRMTWRVDLEGYDGAWDPVFFAFGVAVDNPSFYGNWWEKPGLSLHFPSRTGIGVAAQIWNDTNDGESDQWREIPPTYPSGQCILDLHCHWLENITSPLEASRWYCEVYQDDNLVFHQTFRAHKNPGQNYKDTIKGFIIDNQNSVLGSHNVYIDNLMVGTSRGGSNIMASQGFDDNTFGVFIKEFDWQYTFQIIDESTI